MEWNDPNLLIGMALFLLVIVVILALIVALIISLARSSSSGGEEERKSVVKAAVEAFTIHLQAQPISAEKCRGVWDGLPYEIEFDFPFQKNIFLIIKIPDAFRMEFDLQRQRDPNKARLVFAGEKSGVLWEKIETGDAVFDRAFSLKTPTEETTRPYFQQVAVRQITDLFFEKGGVRICLDGKTLRLSCFCPRDAVGSEDFLKIAQALITNQSNLQIDPALWAGQSRRRRAKKILIGTLSVLIVLGPSLLLVNDIASSIFYKVNLLFHKTYDEWGLFLFSLRWSVPLCGLFLAAYYSIFKNDRSKKSLINTIVEMVLVGAFFLLAAYFPAYILNSKLDNKQPVFRSLPVLDRHLSFTSRRGAIFFLGIKSWRPGEVEETIKVDQSMYQRAEPGKAVAVLEIKPGRFGFEWLKSIKIMPKEGVSKRSSNKSPNEVQPKTSP